MTGAVGALTRASWYQARSYRLSLLMQVGGIMLTVVPIYFIARAVQPIAANAIAGESEQYFSFVLIGSIAMMFISTAMSSLQGSISAGISTGYFEALLMTRAPLPLILAGLTSYGMLLTTVRSVVMVLAGWFMGAKIVLWGILPAVLILALLVAAHWAIGLVAAALVVAFRTAGPLLQGVSTLSVFFGGVYFPVSAIPSWLGVIAKVTPMAYGLRPLRQVLLQGESLLSVAGDVSVLALITVVLLVVGTLAMRAALRYARKAGTLGLY